MLTADDAYGVVRESKTYKSNNNLPYMYVYEDIDIYAHHLQYINRILEYREAI